MLIELWSKSKTLQLSTITCSYIYIYIYTLYICFNLNDGSLKSFAASKLLREQLLSAVVSEQWSGSLNERLTADLQKLQVSGLLSGLGISNEEISMIVKAVGLSRGQCYKCPHDMFGLV